jgi:hypothetical protein
MESTKESEKKKNLDTDDLSEKSYELSEDEDFFDENLLSDDEEKNKPKELEKVQKKRGRKPKVKIAQDIENEKIPKKRGRKPKEKIYSVKELPKILFEENKSESLILHLPITPIDKVDNDPLPNLLNNLSYSMYNLNENNLLPTQNNLMNNELMNGEILNNNFSEYKKEELEIKKDNEDDFKTNKVIKKSLKNIMYEFINANNDKEWPEKTNIYCWWCCHQFTWMPCALPEYYKKDKFYVSGCFCTFNCASSYNFSKNDDDIWERYSLLNLMYKKLYNDKFVKISLAPPREILQIFGGYMSIDEFRDNSLRNEKMFTVIKPPLISIIPKIEENIANNSKNMKNSTQNINETILNKTQSTLKLKRTKPITNPNSTLQSFMDLKII